MATAAEVKIPTATYGVGDRVRCEKGWIRIISRVDGTLVDGEPWYKFERDNDQNPYRHWTYPWGYLPKKLDTGEMIESGQFEPFYFEVLAGKVQVDGRSSVEDAKKRDEIVTKHWDAVKKTWRSRNQNVEDEMAELKRLSSMPVEA